MIPDLLADLLAERLILLDFPLEYNLPLQHVSGGFPCGEGLYKFMFVLFCFIGFE